MTQEQEQALIQAVRYSVNTIANLETRISSLEGKLDELYNVLSQPREPLSANLSKSSSRDMTDSEYRDLAHRLLKYNLSMGTKKFLEDLLKKSNYSVKQKAAIHSIAQQHNIL